MNISAQENHLFDAEITLTGQSPTIRKAAIRQGLYDVLQRVMVAEPSEVEQDMTVQTILAAASQYVETFYTAVESESGQQVMYVSFKKAALLERLRNGVLSFWVASRPKILLWLVVEKEQQRGFFYPQVHSAIQETLLAQSSRLGFQPLFPLFDLDDYMLLTVNDVVLNDSEKIRRVSNRYHVDVILSGVIKRDDNCWQGRWSLLFRDQAHNWEQSCIQLPALVQSTLRNVYRELAPQLAIQPDNQKVQDSFLMKVAGINEMQNLHQLTRYFKSIDLIRSFYGYKIEDGSNFYKIEFNGDWTSLVNKFLLDKVIQTTQDVSVMSELVEFQFRQE
ncbi:MAG TPA: DUF2066 domain-containing protein [Methylococcaceae bacterium]|nr:DUF2066 domain-containing protein [Methylococcaceae bacterium]HIO45316.1 DUF2066 domain-containing protein [Methylococcales bacterium]